MNQAGAPVQPHPSPSGQQRPSAQSAVSWVCTSVRLVVPAAACEPWQGCAANMGSDSSPRHPTTVICSSRHCLLSNHVPHTQQHGAPKTKLDTLYCRMLLRTFPGRASRPSLLQLQQPCKSSRDAVASSACGLLLIKPALLQCKLPQLLAPPSSPMAAASAGSPATPDCCSRGNSRPSSAPPPGRLNLSQAVMQGQRRRDRRVAKLETKRQPSDAAIEDARGRAHCRACAGWHLHCQALPLVNCRLGSAAAAAAAAAAVLTCLSAAACPSFHLTAAAASAALSAWLSPWSLRPSSPVDQARWQMRPSSLWSKHHIRQQHA